MLGAHSSQLMMSTDSSEKWNSLITPRLTVTCFQISIIRNWQPRMKRSQCWRRKWKEGIQSLLFAVRNPTFCQGSSVKTEKWFIRKVVLGMGRTSEWQWTFLPSGLNSLIENLWRDFPGGPVVKNLPAHAGDTVQSLVWQDFTCFRATKLRDHNHWARTLEHSLCNEESHRNEQARCCSEE